MKKVTKIFSFLAVLVLFVFANTSFKLYQCNNIIKSRCIPALKPYIHNGQFNTISLMPGESASTVVSFYSGHTYRISACAQNDVPGTHFEIKTPNDQVLYSSKDQDNTWDFQVSSTRKLIIDIVSENGAEQEACVGLAIGFLE